MALAVRRRDVISRSFARMESASCNHEAQSNSSIDEGPKIKGVLDAQGLDQKEPRDKASCHRAERVYRVGQWKAGRRLFALLYDEPAHGRKCGADQR